MRSVEPDALTTIHDIHCLTTQEHHSAPLQLSGNRVYSFRERRWGQGSLIFRLLSDCVYDADALRGGVPAAVNSVNQFFTCLMVPRVLSHGPVENAILYHYASGRLSSFISEKLRMMSICCASLKGIVILDGRSACDPVSKVQ